MKNAEIGPPFAAIHVGAAMNASKIPTILVSVDKSGHVNQCLGFCCLMGWTVDEIFRVPNSSRMQSFLKRQQAALLRRIYVAGRTPRRRQFEKLRIVASGSAAGHLVRRYRDLYKDNLFAVFVGSPKLGESIFDLAIASHHEVAGGSASGTTYPAAKRTLWIAGILTREVKSADRRDDLAVALIGGLNKAFKIDSDRIASQLLTGKVSGKTLAVVFSRRTPLEVEQRLRRLLASPDVRFVDRADRAGFEDVLGKAGEFFVTPDSITMICEACSTGRTVTLLDLPCFDADTPTARFVYEFLDKGYVRMVGGAERPIEPLPSVAGIRQDVGRIYEAWSRA